MERIVDNLSLYGLSDMESRVLVTLANIGPVQASLIARKLGVNRMKVYRVLKRLQEKGLVDSILGRPVKFAAIPVDKALELLIEKAKKKVAEMEAKQSDIVEAWSNIRVIPHETFGPRFRINQGRKNVYTSIVKMLQEAEKEVDLVVTVNELYRMIFAGLDDSLRECSRRNVEVRILTEINERSIKAVKGYMSYTSIRHTDLSGNMRFLIVDEEEVLTSVAMDDSISLETKQDIGLWTDSKDYVQAIKVFFDELWVNALDASDVIKAVEMGRTIEEVRIIRDVEDYITHYIRMIASSSSEALIFTGDIKTPNISPASLRLLEDISSHGILVKVLTPITQDNMLEVERISKYAQVRHINPPLKTEFLVVDRHEILLSFITEEPEKTESSRRNIWSNIKNYSDFMASVFEEFWLRGVNARSKLEALQAWRTFKEDLETLKPILKNKGWILEIPGEARGKSGTLHKFDFIIKEAEETSRFIVGDFLANRDNAIQTIMAMRMKSLDVEPLNRILFLPKINLNKEERELTRFYKIKVFKTEKLKTTGPALIEKMVPRRLY